MTVTSIIITNTTTSIAKDKFTSNKFNKLYWVLNLLAADIREGKYKMARYKETKRQRDKETNRQTDKETNRQTDKQTCRCKKMPRLRNLSILCWINLVIKFFLK